MGAMKEPAVDLYLVDYYAWIHDQAAALERGDLAGLDRVRLIEEVESLGRSQVDQLESRMEQLLMHLLKWQYQPAKRTGSWTASIREQRRRIARLLKRMPSLRPKLFELLDDDYEDARELAAVETGLDLATFPSSCPYDVADILSDGWLPVELGS